MTHAPSAPRSSLPRPATSPAPCSGHWISMTSLAPTATGSIPWSPSQAWVEACSVDNGVDFMDQVFHAMESLFPQRIADEFVLHQRNSLLIHLRITPLVNQLLHHFASGIAICYVWINKF